VATVLLACAESGDTEALVPDIAKMAKIHYSIALYWINIFESCGFINVTRYENRENAISRHNRHIVVHTTAQKRLSNLYNYMWLQHWEQKFLAGIGEKHLSLVERAA